MIEISESAQAHFRKLIEREDLPGLGVRLAAEQPGTATANVRLEFAGPDDLKGDEWAIDCAAFTLWVDAASVRWLDGGCHGCGMVDVTLRNGIEKTLLAKVPGVTAVRDATDHDTGQAPYVPRDAA